MPAGGSGAEPPPSRAAGRAKLRKTGASLLDLRPVPDIPARIGRYEIERLLGQGAMGSVYLGRDPELDRAVAIKTVRKLDLEEQRLRTFLERFRNEARAAGRLSHPSIVAVYDVGEDASLGPYLVLEYVAGSTLKQIVRGRGPLPPEQLVRLGRQIAAAIDTAHAAGVIHRDIKPDNILVGASGDAKLADFGVARVPDAALTREGQFLGTPCYAAPETIDHGDYGPHTDLFSFAAVLYEAATGVRAFPGDDAVAVAHKVVHDHPPPPSEVAPSARIPKELDRVLARGLSKERAERYRSATELMETVRAAYIGAGLIEDDGSALPIEPPTSSSRWVFGAVLFGLLVVGVGLVLAYGDLDLGLATPPPDEPDAGPSADAGDSQVELLDAGALSIEVLDAGPLPPFDAGLPDAGPPDAGAMPDVSQMSGFDREQAAKDAIDRARARLAAGDLDGAALEVAHARVYDEGNSDIEPLEDEIRSARRRGRVEPDGLPAVP